VQDIAGKTAIVVGGGIGGLTAAVALRQAGIEAVVYERAPRLRAIGAGVHLWNNATRVLKHLGFFEQILETGVEHDRAEFRTADGRPIAIWRLRELNDRLGAPTVGIGRPELHRILAGALGEDAVEVSAECVGFHEDPSGVEAELADGRRARADILVGADGIGSIVREQLLGASPPRYAGYTVWRAILEDTHDAIPRGSFVSWAGGGSRFVAYHVGPGRLYWMAVTNAPPGGEDGPGGATPGLLERHRGWAAPAEEIIVATRDRDIHRSDVYDRPPVRRWGAGRITLLGDAVHPMTFNVGQGAGQAIEDAVVLAARLGAETDAPRALAAYARSRRRRTAKLQKIAWRIGRMHRWEHPVAVAGREWAMRATWERFAFPMQKRDLAFDAGRELAAQLAAA
jgi:2-polyprenyl-6-methoxyphenol hydroxylase-like FAD-dependent oxidoreductase